MLRGWLGPVAFVLLALALYWYGAAAVLDDMIHAAIVQNRAQASRE